MAPDTTGAASTDAARSSALAHLAVSLALGVHDVEEAAEAQRSDSSGRSSVSSPPFGVLRPGGALVVKLLEGPGHARASLTALCRPRFAKVLWARPSATRPESREVFLVALGRRGT